MAEGTSYGIVPFMNKQQLAVVSALVGAGGNLGAVIAGFCFYKPIEDELLPFKVHAVYVMFWALLSPCYYWKEHGGMFHGPAVAEKSRQLIRLRLLICKCVLTNSTWRREISLPVFSCIFIVFSI